MVDVVCEREGVSLRIAGVVYAVTLQQNRRGRGWSAILADYPTPQGPLIGDGPSEVAALAGLIDHAARLEGAT
jgi:hypothetical protein